MSIVNPVDLVLGVRSMCRSQEEDALSTVSRIRCRADPALTLVSLDSAADTLTGKTLSQTMRPMEGVSSAEMCSWFGFQTSSRTPAAHRGNGLGRNPPVVGSPLRLEVLPNVMHGSGFSCGTTTYGVQYFGVGGGQCTQKGSGGSIYARSRMPTSQNFPSTHSGE